MSRQSTEAAGLATLGAWGHPRLCLVRNATRDYLDVVALADRLGRPDGARVLLHLDDYYADQQGTGGRRVATQVAKQLADPHGPLAARVEGLVEAFPMYGTSALWQAWLRRCRRAAR